MVGGVGATIDQIKGTDKTFKESYRENREEQRLKQQVDDINYPLLTATGKIGGGVLGAARLPGATTFTGSVGYSALQGAGASEEEDLAGITKDAAIGGAFGAAGYGLGAAINNRKEIIEGTKNLAKSGTARIATAAKAAGREAMSGNAPAGETMLDTAFTMMGIPAPLRSIRSFKAGWNEGKAIAAAKGEFDEAVQALSKTFGPGAATNLSDNDILMQKLLEEGIAGMPNPAHQLVASKFAQAHGGDADQYLKLLMRSPDELAAAQRFNPIEAGEELAPQFDEAYKTLRGETGKRYQALSAEAREQFQKVDATPMEELQGILKTIDDDTTVSSTSKNYIREGMKRLGDDFADLEPAEQFDRLVAAKDKLKGGAKWAARNEVPEGASAVRNASQSVDKYLKALDARKTADAEWTTLSRLEDNLFKKIGTVKGGRVQSIDPIKLEKIFSGSATGRQLMKEVVKAEEILAKGNLPPDKVASIQQVLDTIKKYADRSQLSRDMSRFRYSDAGPSSPAVQRMAAAAGNDSAVTTAVRSPQIFLKMKAAAEPAAQSIYGKSFSKLSSDEKRVVSKYALWISQNDGVSDVEIKRKISELMSGKKLPGSSLAGGTTLDNLGDFVIRATAKAGAEEVYSAVTGEDELPDPLKDQVVKYMAEKYNLSETEQKVLRRLLPGVYDAARFAGRAANIVPEKKYKPLGVKPTKDMAPKDVERAIERYTLDGFMDVARDAGPKRASDRYVQSLYGSLSDKNKLRELLSQKGGRNYNPAPEKIFRVHHDEGPFIKDVIEAKAGDVLITDQPRSFTYDDGAIESLIEDRTNRRSVILKVLNNTEGTNITPWSHHSYQREVLVPEGVRYRIVGKSIDEESGLPVIELEEIKHSP
jgi:hypothetical protein